MNYETIENLNNDEVLNLYDDILDDNNLLSVRYIGTWNCTINGRSVSCYIGIGDGNTQAYVPYYAQCSNGMYGQGIWCEGWYSATCAAFWGCRRYGYYSSVCPRGCP